MLSELTIIVFVINSLEIILRYFVFNNLLLAGPALHCNLYSDSQKKSHTAMWYDMSPSPTPYYNTKPKRTVKSVDSLEHGDQSHKKYTSSTKLEVRKTSLCEPVWVGRHQCNTIQRLNWFNLRSISNLCWYIDQQHNTYFIAFIFTLIEMLFKLILLVDITADIRCFLQVFIFLIGVFLLSLWVHRVQHVSVIQHLHVKQRKRSDRIKKLNVLRNKANAVVNILEEKKKKESWTKHFSQKGTRSERCD